MSVFLFFFFNDTATTEIYTLSLHDALPICRDRGKVNEPDAVGEIAKQCSSDLDGQACLACSPRTGQGEQRSEEHTSELQSRQYLVCRLLLEKKKKQYI